EAGLFHLVTHAFFKSLLFLAAGSVIVACRHEQDVTRLGGLRKRMPVTAYTSLVGVIAIAGLAVPWFEPFGEAIALSGYHSKDSILAAALAFARANPQHGLLFALPLVTAGLTAFYMFRFWLLAFAGPPRDESLHRHVKESSPLMTVPLVLLALFAAFVAVGGEEGALFGAIEGSGGVATPPLHHGSDAYTAIHHTASLWGLLAGTIGAALALLVYGAGLLDPGRSAAFFGPVRGFLADGWRLDAVYRAAVVRPVEFVAFAASLFDRFVFDGLAHGAGRLTVALARLDRTIDERVVDGFVNRLAEATYATGRSLRHVQTGRLRQYVMALAAAAVILFALAVVLIPKG
ncbi:MAG TPA: proton-conducting transporter membrane subunit, partial [Planctomycetaceae bacterium]